MTQTYTGFDANSEASSKNGHSRKDDDTLAREYLEAFVRGETTQRPNNIKPHVANWDRLCSTLEQFCVGDADWAKKTIEAHKRNKMFAGLKELLEPPKVKINTPVPADEDASNPEELQEIDDTPLLPQPAQLDTSLAEGACPWLDEYVPYSEKASPEGWKDFHPFGGIQTLAAVAANRVYLPMQRAKISTGLKVVFNARSTLWAKSATADVASELLDAAGLGFLKAPRKTTPAKLLSDMAGKYLPKDYAEWEIERQEAYKKKMAMAGQKTMRFDEFGKFIQAMTQKNSILADFETIFLEFDNPPDVYEPATIVRESEPIENPYLTVLGCMTPSNILMAAKSGADFWTNGLWARFCFVTAPLEGGIIDTRKPGELPIPQRLIDDLKAWHQRLGVPRIEIDPVRDKNGDPSGRYTIEKTVPFISHPCTITNEAFRAYEQYRIALKTMRFPHYDFDASYGRLPEMALRMAILMASLSNNNHIEIRHWAKAQELAEILRRSLHRLYNQVNNHHFTGESQDIRIDKAVEQYMRNGHPDVSVRDIVRNCRGAGGKAKPVEDAFKILEQDGIVKGDVPKGTRQRRYKLIADPKHASTEDVEIIEDMEENGL